jgi:hypothetical protein
MRLCIEEQQLDASKETKVFEKCTSFHIMPYSFIVSLLLLRKVMNV